MAPLPLLRPGPLLDVQRAAGLALHLWFACVCDASSLAGVPGLLESHRGMKEGGQEEEHKEDSDSSSEGKWFLL